MNSYIHFTGVLIACLLVGINDLAAQDEDIKGGRFSHRNHYFLLGKEAFEAGRYEKAIEDFDEGLKYDPYHLDSYFLRAMAKENLEDKEGALTDYSIMLHMAPDHTEALFGRGLLHYHMGRYEFAEKDFLQLLNTPVEETNAIFFQLSNYESGTVGVLTMEAMEAGVHNYLGLVRTKLKKYEQAIDSFNRAIMLNGAEPDYYINRGLAREESGQLEMAKTDFAQALRIDPANSLAKYNLLRHSDDRQSIDIYTDLINGDPEFAEPYAQRGLARFNSGDYKGALKDYNKALSLNDLDPENFLNRGLIKEKLKDVKGAFEDYSAAIRLKSDYAKAYLNRANVLTRQRKFAEAIQDYDRSIRLDPLNAAGFYNRGVAKYNSGSLAACDDVTRAYELGMESAKKAVDYMCKE